MKNLIRGIRRYHVTRLKNNRKNYWGNGRSHGTETPVMSPRQLGRVAQNPQLCSCYMCGNERKHFNKPTIQERRFNQTIDF